MVAMRCVRRNARRRMRNARGQLGDLNELLGSGDVGRVARGRQSSQGGARPDAEGRRSAWSENGRRRPPHTHTAIQLARQREAGAEHRPRGVPCPISCPRPLYHSNARPPKEVRVHGKHGPSGVTSWPTAAIPMEIVATAYSCSPYGEPLLQLYANKKAAVRVHTKDLLSLPLHLARLCSRRQEGRRREAGGREQQGGSSG